MKPFVLALLVVADRSGLAAAGAEPADQDPPSIVHLPVRAAIRHQELRFEVEIIDASGIFEPRLYWRLAGETEWRNDPLIPAEGDRYFAMLPPQQVTGDLEYFVEAYDAVGNGPGRLGAPGKPLRIQVKPGELPPPPPAAPELVPVPLVVERVPTPEIETAGIITGPGRGPWAWVAVGAGVVAAGAGAYFGLAARSAATERRNSVAQAWLDADARTRGLARNATVSWIGAGVFAAGGVALLLFTDF